MVMTCPRDPSDLYGGGDSAVTRLPADYNAFDARDALYSIQYYGTIPDSVSDEDGIAFIQGMKKAVEDNQPETQFKEYGECGFSRVLSFAMRILSSV